MKKLCIFLLFLLPFLAGQAQDSARTAPPGKRESRRQKINSLMKQAEEGVLVYRRQTIFGGQFRTNGYGGFVEIGRMKTTRRTTIYRLDITEIKHPKEERLSSGAFFFGNPFVYGKINNFYQVNLGFGQQLMLGQKGNRNGVAVSAVYSGGLALGLLRPYYLQVEDPLSGEDRVIKYTAADSALFLGPTILGRGGLGKGWGEMKLRPGVFGRAALRFDYGRFNEMVSGVEVGITAEYYAQKVPIMLFQKDRSLFFQGYISLLMGRRK